MAAKAGSEFLSGLVIPIATPITESEEVSEEALRKLVRHLLAGGADCLFLLGTTAEVGPLMERERQRALEIALDENAGQVPIVVGVSAEGTKRVCARIKSVAKNKIAGLVAMPPYYYPLVCQKEVVSFYRTVMAGTDLPFILYNYPGIAGISIAPETAKELSKVKNCVGLKDSSDDFHYFQSLAAEKDITAKISLLQGSEKLLLPSLLIGAAGAVSGIANIVPRLFKKLLTAVQEDDLKQARRLNDRALSLCRIVYGWEGTSLAAVKAALSMLGFGDNYVSSPYRAAQSEVVEQLQRVLDEVQDDLRP